MSRFVRTVARLVHRRVHQPWEYERLATPEEIKELTKVALAA